MKPARSIPATCKVQLIQRPAIELFLCLAMAFLTMASTCALLAFVASELEQAIPQLWHMNFLHAINAK